MSIDFLKLNIYMFDSKKIDLVRQYPAGDSLFVIWIWLLCEAMKSDHPGYIYIAKDFPCDPQYISNKLNIDIKTVELGLELFDRLGMVNILEDGKIEISNFNKYQKLDLIERQRQISRESSQRYRAKNRSELVTVTSRDVTVKKSDAVDLDLDSDKEKDLEKSKKKEEANRPFLPLSQLLYSEHLKSDPAYKPGRDMDIVYNRWANDIRLLVTVDGRSVDDVREVIKWCKTPGSFWVPNIMSGKKLRLKFPTLWLQYQQSLKKPVEEEIDPLTQEYLDACEAENDN